MNRLERIVVINCAIKIVLLMWLVIVVPSLYFLFFSKMTVKDLHEIICTVGPHECGTR